MATSSSPVLPQTPESAGINFGSSSQSTDMAPGSVAPTELLTAAGDGALVTDITVTAQSSVSAEKFVLWKQINGTGNWYVVTTAPLPAYTQATNDEQSAVKLIDKTDPTQAVRLGSGDKLGVTHHVDQSSMVSCEYTSYTAP